MHRHVFVALGPLSDHDYHHLKVNSREYLKTELSEVGSSTTYDLQVVNPSSSAAQFPAPSTVTTMMQICVQADPNNAKTVYVGKTGVKSDKTTGAIGLAPGQFFPLPNNTYTNWYHVAADTAQYLYIWYLGTA